MYTSKTDTFLKMQKKPKFFDDNTRRTFAPKKKGHHSHEVTQPVIVMKRPH